MVSYKIVIVLYGSKLPRYHVLVFPLPITLSDTKGLALFNEWQWPNAPFMTTSLDTRTEIIPSVYKSIWGAYWWGG